MVCFKIHWSWVVALLVDCLFLSLTRADDTSSRQEAAQRLIDALTPIAAAKGEYIGDLNVIAEDSHLLFGDDLFRTYLDTVMDDPQHANDEEEQEAVYYADQYVLDMLEIVNDPDCMTGELDASAEDFDVQKAIDILSKCGLVLIRNAIPHGVLEPFKKNVTSYIRGIETGRINPEGTTNYGEGYYIHETSAHRYDLCFTPDLLNEDLMAHPEMLEILKDNRVLGEEMTMLDFGAIVSEPGAKFQRWHSDGDVFPSLFHSHGIAGYDLPPHAVGVMIPLLNTTARHGPTEFCMGYNAFAHLEYWDVPIKNETLMEEYLRAVEYWAVDACPPEFFRTPQPQFGDIQLFHYNMLHRGGENTSPDVRTILYNTYARSWYKDENFMLEAKRGSTVGSTEEIRELFNFARIGIPDNYAPEETADHYALDDLEKMGQFRPKGGMKAGDHEIDGKVYEFLVTNLDVDLDDLKVCIAKPSNGTGCIAAPGISDFIHVSAQGGEEVQVWNGETHLKSWATRGENQLMIAYRFFDVCLWEDKC